MEVTGKSLWQQEQIDALKGRLTAAETDLEAKLYKHIYDGKIAILESNDARHNADIAHLEANTVLKTEFNTKIGILGAKDAEQDIKISVLDALKESKKDTVAYLDEMALVDTQLKGVGGHEERIEALEARATQMEDDIEEIVEEKLKEKVDKVVFEQVKQELQNANSSFTQDLKDFVSKTAQKAIDDAQDAVIDGKVDKATFNQETDKLAQNNVTWDKRLNAVDQYILAMLQTYKINIPGVGDFDYTANYVHTLPIEKKHFKIVGRKIPNIIVVELAPFAYNAFYGKMELKLNNSSIPVVIATKANIGSTVAPYRVDLNMGNVTLTNLSFPIDVIMYDTAGDIIHQASLLTESVFQNPIATPILSAPLFNYSSSNLKLVAKNIVNGIMIWEKNYTFDPIGVSGSSIAGVTWHQIGTLPAGLNFDTSNGRISGVPTATGNFQIQVYGKYTGQNDENGIQVNFEIVNVPAISYSGIPTEYTRYNTYADVLPTIAQGSGPITSFSVNPPLPVGMYLNTATGAIGGTPTVVSPAVTYTVTANGIELGGNGTTSFSFAVKQAVPKFTYEFSSVEPKYVVSLPVDVAMPDIMPNIAPDSGPIISYAISDTLPPGLSLDATTGKISGTPTAPYLSTTYTITATGSGGSGSALVVIGVKADIPVFTYNANNEYLQGDEIAPLAPVAGVDSGAVNATNGYALFNLAGTSPATPPPGLTFNTNDGKISGTPTAPMATTGYSVKATGPGGVSSPVPFYITVKMALPVISYVAPPVATRGVAITAFGPTATNSPTYYSITPLVPIGMNFNNATGFLSGTPAVVSDSTEYTVIAYNAGGASDPATFSLQVVEPAPVIAYNVSGEQAFVVGTPIALIVPSLAKNRIDRWIVSGNIPPGLVIDSATGIISGTPSVRNTEAVTVTVTAIGNGTNTFNIQMRVREPAPTFTYPVGTKVFKVGVEGNHAATQTNVAISAIKPNGWVLASGSVLPDGLNLNTNTGAISGKAIAVGGPITVNVIAQGHDFNSAPVPVVIDVNDEVPPGAVTPIQEAGSDEFELKVWSNPASNDDTAYVKKLSTGSVTANLAYSTPDDIDRFVAIKDAVTFANSDYYSFVFDRATEYNRLAVVANPGEEDQQVLALFAIFPKQTVFAVPVVTIPSDAVLTYAPNENISIELVNTGGPINNYVLESDSDTGLTFNVAGQTLGGSIATAGSYTFKFKAVGPGGVSSVVEVTVVVSDPPPPAPPAIPELTNLSFDYATKTLTFTLTPPDKIIDIYSINGNYYGSFNGLNGNSYPIVSNEFPSSGTLEFKYFAGAASVIIATLPYSAPPPSSSDSPQIITSGSRFDFTYRFTPDITLPNSTYWNVQISSDENTWENLNMGMSAKITEGVEVIISNGYYPGLQGYSLIKIVLDTDYNTIIAGPSPIIFT